MCTLQLVELGIEMVNPLALQKLLRKCENLRTLHLGGLWSVQFSDGQMTTAFKKGVCPALQVGARWTHIDRSAAVHNQGANC